MLKAIRHRSFLTLLVGLIIGSWAVTITGCNTVKGAGRDVEAVGEAGEDVLQGEDPLD